jgi:phage-related protein (TIGR01555 family)
MKLSVKAAVRDAVAAEKRSAKAMVGYQGVSLGAVATNDSFVNFAQKLGVGADNALTSGTYGYNPVTRNRVLLEWIHRGSWLGGIAVDLVADDMTRAGIDFVSEMDPDEAEELDNEATTLGIWDVYNEAVRWGRLYGGSLAVMLVDGQDFKTPLRLETVGKDQFKGLLCLDRWMVEPTLEDLVTDFGPHLGQPKYYRVQSNAPALRGQVIHHSRIASRFEGIQLPYQQRLTENLWGISVLERLYDRMIAFDSASTGAAQLVYKSYLRTLKVKGMRQIIAGGGKPLDGLIQYTEIMRRFQGMEGITLLDGDDEFDVQEHSAFSGLSDALNQFGQQLSGALQIPLVRMFGQSPAGLNSSGESDLRTYYDGVRQQQRKTMLTGMTSVYKLMAQSKGIKVPKNFTIDFASLWELDDVQKADVASKTTESVTKAFDAGLIGRQTALKELRQSSRTTGVFTNITQQTIDDADDEVEPPLGEGFEIDPLTGLPAAPEPDTGLPGDENEVRPNGQAAKVGGGQARRVALQ